MKPWHLTMTVPAVALAFLAGCSSDSGGTGDTTHAAGTTTAATQAASAPTATTAPAGTSASTSAASAPAAGNKTEACKQLDTIKTEMIKTMTGAMTGDGKVPPAKAKKILSDTAGKLHDAAAKADGDVATAMKGLADELSKASAARDPYGQISAENVTSAGEKLDRACGNS